MRNITSSSTLFKDIDLFFILANLLTLGNIISGILGINFANEGNLTLAMQLMLLGEIFDLFDGQLAKKSSYKGSLGFYADSLADLVTFVILPAYMALNIDLFGSSIKFVIMNLVFDLSQLWVAAYAIGGWARLIRYAAEPTKSQFVGLPTAAASMLVGSLVVIASSFNLNILGIDIVIPITLIACGALMVSNITYPSPKRMLKPDNILINVAILVGAIFVVFPTLISNIALIIISVLYTVVGPIYYLKTEEYITSE